MLLALFLPSPVVQELDALSLSEEILFPRPATDRKMVVNSLSQQNPKKVKKRRNIWEKINKENLEIFFYADNNFHYEDQLREKKWKRKREIRGWHV